MRPTSAYWEYLWKTIKWFIGNLLFGLAPIVFMCAMYYISEHKFGGEQVNNLVREGVILFVLCAIMGSILLDYALGEYKFSGWEIFHIFIAPLIILTFICLNYLLICLTILDVKRFEIASTTSTVCCILSVVYCLLQKTNLYMKEDSTKSIKQPID